MVGGAGRGRTGAEPPRAAALRWIAAHGARSGEGLERARGSPAGLISRVEPVARGDRGGAIGGRTRGGRQRRGLVAVLRRCQRSSITTSSSGDARLRTSRPPRGPGADGPLVGPAEAEVGDRVDARRDAEQRRAGRRAGRSSPNRRPVPRRARRATGSRSRRRSSRRRSRGSSPRPDLARPGRRGRSRRRSPAAPRRPPRSSGQGSGERARRSGRAWRSRSRCASRRISLRVAIARITIRRHGCMRPTEGAWWAAPRTRRRTSSPTSSARNRRMSRRSAMAR